MPLSRRIQLLFLAFAVVTLAQFAADRYVDAEQEEARARVEGELLPAREALSTMLTSLVDQETGQRGFVITGQERFLEPYRQGRQGVDQAFADLRRLLAGERALLAGVDRIENRVSAWRQLGAEFEIEAKRSGRDEEAVALVATGTAKDLFDRARDEMAGVRDDLIEELRAEQARVDRLDSSLAAVSAVGFAVNLLLAATGAVLLQAWSIRPLARLTAAVRRVAAGGLQTTIKGEGPPDLARLGEDVEGMRRRILAEIEDASRSREALAKRGLVVLTLRDELAPRSPCLPEGISLAARMEPAEGVLAGDWYDVVPLPGGRLALILVDVSGHATESGVFAVKTKHLALAALDGQRAPGEVLGWLADQLGDTGDNFLTGAIIELDPSAGRLRYASAGHPSVLLLAGEEVVELAPTGPLLGPLPTSWHTEEIELAPGHIVALYSDGLTEAENDRHQEFGTERLVSALLCSGAGLEGRVDHALAALQRFHPGRYRDDVTLLLASWAPSVPNSGR